MVEISLTRKQTRNTVIILSVIAVLGVVALIWGPFFKYSINGTISECTMKGKTVYQFVTNTREAKPRHFTENGNYIPCSFSEKVPSSSCRLVLASLQGCRLIYRTNNNWQSLPGIYEQDAARAVRVLKSKVK